MPNASRRRIQAPICPEKCHRAVRRTALWLVTRLRPANYTCRGENGKSGLVEISDSTDAGAAIRSEYTTLSDIYHALGACRAGIQFAWIVSASACIAYIIDGQSFWASVLTMVLTLLATLVLFWVFHRARGHTWVSAQESLKFGLTALFKRRPDLLGDGTTMAE